MNTYKEISQGLEKKDANSIAFIKEKLSEIKKKEKVDLVEMAVKYGKRRKTK